MVRNEWWGGPIGVRYSLETMRFDDDGLHARYFVAGPDPHGLEAFLRRQGELWNAGDRTGFLAAYREYAPQGALNPSRSGDVEAGCRWRRPPHRSVIPPIRWRRSGAECGNYVTPGQVHHFLDHILGKSAHVRDEADPRQPELILSKRDAIGRLGGAPYDGNCVV